MVESKLIMEMKSRTCLALHIVLHLALYLILHLATCLKCTLPCL